MKPNPVVVQSKARVVMDRSKTGIVGSYLARGVDIRPHLFSVLCCPM
jgi:hypothetical protein